MRLLRPALLLLLPAAPAHAQTVEPFVDYYFDSGLSKIKNPSLDDHLRLTFFRKLLTTVKPADFDRQIDLELLTLLVDAGIEWFRLHQKGAHVPTVDFVGLPSDYAKQLTTLCKDVAANVKALERELSTVTLPKELSQAQIDAAKAQLDAALQASDGEEVRPIKKALERLRRAFEKIRPTGQAPPDRKPTPYDLYRWRLKYELYVDLTPEQLLDFAIGYYDRTVKELEAIGKKVGKHWHQLVEDSKRKQFTIETLHDESAKLAYAARDFCVQKDLVTVPDSAKDFEVRRADVRAITPFGHYQPRRGDTKGAYISAPISDKMKEEELRQRLRDNNLYWTGVVALHEAVPGHHLQFEVARTLKRGRLRDAFYPTTYIEGWGLYAEDMMFKNGFFDTSDPLWELTLLRMRLWRCARVIIDVGLQTKAMTKEDAVRLLVEGVRMEPLSAKFEVGHYASRPTYFCGYLLGYDFFVRLRHEIEQLMGKAFDQKKFHDTLLQVGPMPKAQLRKIMLQWAKPD